jgi:alanine racemase
VDDKTAQKQTTFTFGPPEAEAGGVLTVDLAAIEANWKQLRRLSIPSECAAVVKGDGYGCGLEPVTALLYHAGCTTFFVADIAEGKRARRVAPEAVIYVLNGVPPGTGSAFAEHYLRPVIGSITELAEWDAFAATNNWHGGFALHVDTGMNRLGVSLEDAAALAPRLRQENHGVTLLMSHFVEAEAAGHARNSEQMGAFREARMLFRGVPASISNSSGIFLGQPAHLDVVRPGAALFGVNPTPGRANPMRPVVELKGRVALVRDISVGATVGYAATWTARRASRIAVVTIGYADGYFRSARSAHAKPSAVMLVAGTPCPIVGRISMDLLALDVTDIPAKSVRRGDLVTAIGEGIDVDTLAKDFGTIGYEVLTSLGRRYARIYRGGSE